MVITPQEYIRSYESFEISDRREPRQSLINNIFSQFKRAELRSLSEDEFWKLIFLYSPDNEIAIRLTNKGTARLLEDVAKKYLEETKKGWTWDSNENKMKPIISILENGEITEISSVFLRAKFPNEPQDGSFYIEDGIHRLLALSVFCLNKHEQPRAKAYIGYFS